MERWEYLPKSRAGRTKPPPGFAKACATHATMMQLSGEAEASGAQISAAIKALDQKYAAEGVHIILSLPNGTDTNTGNHKLGKEAAVSIIKVLLPGIDPGAKGKHYKIIVACEKWLSDFAGGVRYIGKQ